MKTHAATWSGFLVALALGGCASAPREPELPSSAGYAGYATAYPDELQSASKTLTDDRVQARSIGSGLGARAAELKGPSDANALVAVIDRADEAGRGRGFASRRADVEAARTFWDEERPAVTGRVVGAAQTKITESKCENTDVSGPVAYSLKEGVDKQLEKRLRARNDAVLLIERNKVAIGAGNVTTAQKRADDVALASYLVNVALPNDRQRIVRLMEEKQTVERTLSRSIDEERALQATPGRTDAEKKASEERILALTKSQNALGGAVVNAEVATRGIDDQIKTARAEYDASLKALKDQIKQRP